MHILSYFIKSGINNTSFHFHSITINILDVLLTQFQTPKVIELGTFFVCIS